MWRVDGAHAHHQRVGGYMSYAPPDILADGFTYLAGLEGTSGAALGRWGPNLFAIRAGPQDGVLPSRALICHPDDARQPAGWWIANKVTDVEWIETPTHHAVLFFVIEGLGQKWYGEPTQDGLTDPYGGGKGYHAEGWTLNAWIYDPSDLRAVFHGERDPWSLTPAEQVVLTQRDPGSAAETHHSLLTGAANADLQVSLRDGRLVILQPGGYQASTYERTPKGYVLNLP
jgi:hypothetical protein